MLDIDIAIKHCLEVAEQNDAQAEKWREEGGEEWGKTTACRECAADHRQLAEWLTELLQRRERCAQYEVEQISNLEQYDMLSREYEILNERYKEAIRLLELAVDDLNNIGSCKTCVKFGDICRGCRTDYKWVHADDALALIGEEGDTNG